MKRVWYFVAGLLLAVAQSSWQSPLQETEAKSREQGLEDREKENLLDQLSSNELVQRHPEYERHADGTYTSDMSSLLEAQAAKEFIAWLVKGRGRRDLSEGSYHTKLFGRRHADGTFHSDYHKILDEMATQEFLKWLFNQKATQRYLNFDESYVAVHVLPTGREKKSTCFSSASVHRHVCCIHTVHEKHKEI